MAEKISQKGKKRVLNEIILVNSWQKKRPKKKSHKRCRPGFSSMGRDDESTLFFILNFQFSGP